MDEKVCRCKQCSFFWKSPYNDDHICTHPTLSGGDADNFDFFETPDWCPLEKKGQLEKDGWKFGSAEEFLGSKTEHTYIECDCSSCEHTIRFTLDNNEEFPCIYVSVQLSRFHNFFGRLWLAIKYVFGHECRFGHWDEAELMGEEVSKLYDLCYKHLQQYQQIKERKR